MFDPSASDSSGQTWSTISRRLTTAGDFRMRSSKMVCSLGVRSSSSPAEVTSRVAGASTRLPTLKLGSPTARSTQQRPDPCEQLVMVEGLYQVVVGALV